VLGGFSVARDFSLDPYFVEGPRTGTTAFAGSPSVLEVWVNGSLVLRQEVAPGTIDLANIPVVAGSNSVRTVLRDAYGREQAFDLRTTYAAGLLAPGLSDYGYHFGFVRQAFGERSFEYGEAALLLRHRIGFTDGLTGGVRVEAAGGGRWPVRPGHRRRPWARWTWRRRERERGGSRRRGRRLVVVDRAALQRGAAAAGRSSRFASASLSTEADRALLEASAFASFPVIDRLDRSGGRGRAAARRGEPELHRPVRLDRPRDRAPLLGDALVEGRLDHGGWTGPRLLCARRARHGPDLGAGRRRLGDR
jgi:outer membrane usher protein